MFCRCYWVASVYLKKNLKPQIYSFSTHWNVMVSVYALALARSYFKHTPKLRLWKKRKKRNRYKGKYDHRNWWRRPKYVDARVSNLFRFIKVSFFLAHTQAALANECTLIHITIKNKSFMHNIPQGHEFVTHDYFFFRCAALKCYSSELTMEITNIIIEHSALMCVYLVAGFLPSKLLDSRWFE